MSLQSLIEFDKQLLLQLNGSDSLFWDGVMVTATATSTWVPLACVLFYVLIKNNNMREVLLVIGLLAFTILLADQFSSSFCKPFFHRFRPSHDPVIMFQVDVVNEYRGGMYGFISSHAANTFGVFVFLSLLVRNRAFTYSMLTWALLNCYSRIYLGVHYPGDILCGALWGSLVGLLAYYVYVRVQSKISSSRAFFSSQYTSTGYLTTDVHLLLAALYLTYLYVVMKGVWWAAAM